MLPTLDEREHITDCIESLLRQDYEAVVEILVVDGGSTDGTRGLAAALGVPVHVLDAPRVSAATAVNVGIAAARGALICRAGARTRYEVDYVSRCVEALCATGAARVGGRARPVGATTFGRAVAAVTSSPYDVAAGRSERDDGAVWAAGDHGSVGAVDAAIRSSRFSPSSAQALAREYCTYGREAVAGLRTPRHVPRWRAVAPAVLVAASVAGLRARNRGVRFAVPALHAAACATAAWRLSEDPGVAPQRAFLALEISQWSYGVGAWSGLLRMLTAGSHGDVAGSRARQFRPA